MALLFSSLEELCADLSILSQIRKLDAKIQKTQCMLSTPINIMPRLQSADRLSLMKPTKSQLAWHVDLTEKSRTRYVGALLTLVAALPDVRLKLDSYGFRSVKTSYDRNLGRTPKSYGFLVSNMKLEIGSKVPAFWLFYASKLAWFWEVKE